MKVLHVLPSISLKLGGPTQVVLNLVKALQDIGIEAEIATTNDDQGGVLDVPLGQRVDYQQVPVYFFPCFPLRMKEFLFSAELTQWLWQNLRSYDLLGTHYIFSYASSCAAILARQFHIPYTVRTIGQLAPWALNQSQLKKQVYSVLIERRNLNNAAAIHCTSIGEVEDVNRFGIKSPKIVLPLGVHPPTPIPDAKQKLRQKYNIPSQTPIILFLSRLHYKKRPDLLIQTLGQVTAQQQPFHLIIAGSGEVAYVNALHQMVASLNLTNHTSFTGFVTGYEKDLLLQGVDLFVLPTYSENFGIVLAEAMVAGLPIITTPGVQIAPDIIRAQAGLIVEGEPAALQNAIVQLLKAPQRRDILGQNGRQLALNHYSWPTIGKNLAASYQAILDHQAFPRCVMPSDFESSHNYGRHIG